MKKSLYFAVVILLVLCCFFACEKKDNATGVTLVIWESSGGPDVFIRKAGKLYTAEHPDVRIKYVNVELSDAATQIALDGPAGIGPDLFVASHDRSGELIKCQHISTIPDDGVTFSHVSPVCHEALCRDNQWIGFPLSAETYVLFFNRTLLAGRPVPTTWDDVLAFTSEFNATNPDRYGFMMDVGNSYYAALFAMNNGNRIFDDDGHVMLNTEDAIAGMQYFQSLRQILNVPASDITTAVCDGAFSSGKCALYITGLWNIAPFIDSGIDFGTATLPSLFDSTTPSASFSGIRTMFVSAYSCHQKEAIDFASFLMSEKMQTLRFKITGAIPADIHNGATVYTAAFQKQLQYALPMPSVPLMNSFWSTLNTACSNIWNGADVQSELDSCCRVIEGQ